MVEKAVARTKKIMKPRTGVYVYVSYSEQQEKKRATIEHNKNAQKNSKQETNQFHFQKKVLSTREKTTKAKKENC